MKPSNGQRMIYELNWSSASIELIISAHSLKEVNTTEDDNKSDSFEEPSSEESDFDFDDESSNQSFVKSQTSQTVSEKSNTFDNKITEPECDSKVNEPIVEEPIIDEPIVSTVETYDSYLGDETGKFTIQKCKSLKFNMEFRLIKMYNFPLQTQKREYNFDFPAVIGIFSSGLAQQN